MARASSPSLEAVLGDVPHAQDLDLDMELSGLDDLPPTPPSRGPGTALGTELDDLLGDLPPDSPGEEKPTRPALAPKPRAKAPTKADLIMQDIYRLLAEIEIEIEKNLTPKNKLAKSDTFGLTQFVPETLVNREPAAAKAAHKKRIKPLLPAQ